MSKTLYLAQLKKVSVAHYAQTIASLPPHQWSRQRSMKLSFLPTFLFAKPDINTNRSHLSQYKREVKKGVPSTFDLSTDVLSIFASKETKKTTPQTKPITKNPLKSVHCTVNRCSKQISEK